MHGRTARNIIEMRCYQRKTAASIVEILHCRPHKRRTFVRVRSARKLIKQNECSAFGFYFGKNAVKMNHLPAEARKSAQAVLHILTEQVYAGKMRQFCFPAKNGEAAQRKQHVQSKRFDRNGFSAHVCARDNG